MLISTWVGWPRSVMSTGSTRATRLARLTSRLNSRLVRSFKATSAGSYVAALCPAAGRYVGTSGRPRLDICRGAGTFRQRAGRPLRNDPGVMETAEMTALTASLRDIAADVFPRHGPAAAA